MNIYSVYEIATGRFTGARLGTTGELNPDLVPDGCSVISGQWAHECWTVDHVTGSPSAMTPPPEDWRLRKYREADAAMADILAAETEQARPMREIVAALLAGAEPPTDAVARLNAITGKITPARARYAAIMGAATLAELEAVLS